MAGHRTMSAAAEARSVSLQKLLLAVVFVAFIPLVWNSKALMKGGSIAVASPSAPVTAVASVGTRRVAAATANEAAGGDNEGGGAEPTDDSPGTNGDGGSAMLEAPPSGAPPAAASLNKDGSRRGIVSSRFANGAAGAAPPHSAVPLFAHSEEDVTAGAGQFVIPESRAQQRMPPGTETVCWDHRGDPANVPAWAVQLFAALPSRGHYDILANATDANPWSMLVAWVPNRFMGPQKDGKNAAGVVIKAPTKGRDPKFYLREYNASWHASASVTPGGFEYHFQLLHRNALAVCIRERLHINSIRCAPSAGMPTALLHHCTCRKCVEPIAQRLSSSERQRIGKVPGWSEATSHVPVLMPKALIEEHPFLQRRPRHVITGYGKDKKAIAAATAAHRPYEGECVQATSAPWLIDRQTVPAFEYEGLEGNFDKILEVQADKDGIVLIAMFNKFWIDHLHNFYFSMVRRGTVRNIVVATLDPEALRVCQANRLPCFDASDYAELEEDMLEGGAGYKAGHTRKVTEAMSWIKPRLAVAVIERGFGFFMVDLDMTWNGWPMRDIVDVGTDLTHQCDAPSHYSINSGYYLARPNYKTWQFFRNLMVFTPEENSDQTAMKLFSRYDHTHGMSNACLDKWLFNMKCNYKKAGSVKVIKGKETFEWAAFDRNRTKFFWRILHATCISGAQAKILYLRTMNAWFLDDLDAITATPGGYCIVHPDGTTITRGHTARTVHSATYTKETDNRFLETRH